MKCLFTVRQAYRYWPAIDRGNVDEETASFQSARNARLPVDNIKTMKGILDDGSFQGLTGAQADYEMVRKEQRLLSTFMKSYEQEVGSLRFTAIMDNLNNALNNARYERDYIGNAKRENGGNIAFRNEKHRVILGKALVDDTRNPE